MSIALFMITDASKEHQSHWISKQVERWSTFSLRISLNFSVKSCGKNLVNKGAGTWLSTAFDFLKSLESRQDCLKMCKIWNCRILSRKPFDSKGSSIYIYDPSQIMHSEGSRSDKCQIDLNLFPHLPELLIAICYLSTERLSPSNHLDFSSFIRCTANQESKQERSFLNTFCTWVPK